MWNNPRTDIILKKVNTPRLRFFAHYALLPLLILSIALFLRWWFFTGFILGDDPLEVSVALYNLENSPIPHDQLHARFFLWFFNVITFRLLGVSELTFFLPTVLMSASFGIIGYLILRAAKYSLKGAFFGGIFIVAAPFEILIGTVRANDLIFGWFLAMGLLFLMLFEKNKILQGILIAAALWAAAYVKIWVVYFLPALAIYYLVDIFWKKQLRGCISFALASLALHGLTGSVFKTYSGTFFPLLDNYVMQHIIPRDQLARLFMEYPRMIFVGSQFDTTLFGYIPYLLLILLLVKGIASSSQKSLRFDKLDIILIAAYGSFFLFLNFFPTTLDFQYRSPPRIFRYLAPLSFPMTLHLAKLILDFGKVGFKRAGAIRKYGLIIFFLLIISVSVYQADDATKPGQIYRGALLPIVEDVKEQSPPQVLSESWLAFFLMEFYLTDLKNDIHTVADTDQAPKYEKWLREIEQTLPSGTMLITGLSTCVHYCCLTCGFRLKYFEGNLSPGWQLYKEYDVLGYLPDPEPARLWQWTVQEDAQKLALG